MIGTPDREQLLVVLERSRAVGFLGPGSVVEHLDHAIALAQTVEDAGAPARCADLGTGGGVPGLVLAVCWPAAHVTLVEAGARRAAFLREAVLSLAVTGRVCVAEGRAEVAGRSPEHRGRYDVVTARSFASPAVTAECAAPLLVPGGRLVVAEPPEPVPNRWPDGGLAALGLGPAEIVRRFDRAFAVVTKRESTPERFPRRVGVPTKRPLWRS